MDVSFFFLFLCFFLLLIFFSSGARQRRVAVHHDGGEVAAPRRRLRHRRRRRGPFRRWEQQEQRDGGRHRRRHRRRVPAPPLDRGLRRRPRRRRRISSKKKAASGLGRGPSPGEVGEGVGREAARHDPVEAQGGHGTQPPEAAVLPPVQALLAAPGRGGEDGKEDAEDACGWVQALVLLRGDGGLSALSGAGAFWRLRRRPRRRGERREVGSRRRNQWFLFFVLFFVPLDGGDLAPRRRRARGPGECRQERAGG